MRATIKQFEVFVKIKESGEDIRNVGVVVKIAQEKYKIKMSRAECLDILYNFDTYEEAKKDGTL